MNAQTGEYGVHAVQLTTTETQKPWAINALVDFGPQHHISDPELVTILDTTTAQRLLQQLSELLEK